MYDDYPVAYESTVNQTMIYWIILGVLVLIAVLLIFIGLAKVFKKANRSSISAWIPFYNLYTYVEITHMPKIYFLLSLIPIVNVFFIVKMISELSKLFKKNQLFTLGLIFLPSVFYPILGFSDSEYVGINLAAYEGKTTVENIPDIDLLKNQKIEIEVNDQEDNKVNQMNISIGGGVYNKKSNNNTPLISKDNLLKTTTSEEKKKQEVEYQEKLMKSNPTNNTLFSVEYIDNSKKEQNTTNPQSVVTENIQQQAPIQQEAQVPDFKICPNCKTRVQGNSSICFICGNHFQ